MKWKIAFLTVAALISAGFITLKYGNIPKINTHLIGHGNGTNGTNPGNGTLHGNGTVKTPPITPAPPPEPPPPVSTNQVTDIPDTDFYRCIFGGKCHVPINSYRNSKELNNNQNNQDNTYLKCVLEGKCHFN